MLAALVIAALGRAAPAAHAADSPGAVYTLTNETSGNRVAVFDRAADGVLTPAGMVATGGMGTGMGLGSQGALIFSDNHRWLFAVNAGSDDISVFAVRPDGLMLMDRAPSGGHMPISLTAHGDVLYVLNAGSSMITGFVVGHDGHLMPLAGSTQPLSGNAVDPAQVQFRPDGRLLIVTEKATSLIDSFPVDRDGRAGAPMFTPSSGEKPFGFAFADRGTLIVSEAAPGALSSYDVSRTGDLAVITATAGDTQQAACWVAVTDDGRYAYTTNAASGSVSAYRVGRDGSLSLLTADGRTGVTGDGSTPIDMALSAGSRVLYVLASGTPAIDAFRVEADGSLTSLGTTGGLMAGMAGLAAW